MILTAWDIYWVTRLDEISIVLSLFVEGGFAACGFSMFAYFVAQGKFIWFKTFAAHLAPVLIVVAIVNAFIPNTKQAAAMIVLPAIVNSEAVQQIPSELTTLAREWLQELRPATKRGAK